MHRWVSEFIQENQGNWEEEKNRQKEKINEELETWNKMKRSVWQKREKEEPEKDTQEITKKISRK